MRRLLLLAAVIVGFTACVNEGVDWTNPTQTTDNVGYLSFNNGGIYVIVDQEAGEHDAKPHSSAGKRAVTRAVSEADLARYTVQIFDAQGTQVVNDFQLGAITELENYRDAGYTNDGKHPALSTGGIELPVGTYTVRVFSAEADNVSATPEYEGSTTVTLNKGVATTAEVVCSLSSVKVTVTFDSNMAQVIAPSSTFVRAQLDEENITTPSAHTWGPYQDQNALVKDHTAVEAIYLKPQTTGSAGVPLNLYLTTLYGATPDGQGQLVGGSQIRDQKLPVGNVEVGQWRKVTIKLDHGSDGTAYFVVTVETWVYNEQIDVTQSTYAATLAEAEIPDVTDAPVIETPQGGIDFTQVLALSEEMFENGVYKGNASMTVKTKQPIKALYISATSDSDAFSGLLTSMGLSVMANSEQYNGLNIVGLSNPLIENTLIAWGFPVANVAGATEVTFDIKGLLQQLQNSANYAGSHTFAMTVVDAKNNNSTTTLQITSGVMESGIVWVGEDISKRYDIYTGGGDPTVMKIKVTALSGIKHLQVEISGQLANVVQDVDLSASFDLVNPLNDDGEDMSTALAGLGFPVGDDVKYKKSISFDITGFKELLGMANVSGENNFKITLTENDDTVIEATMMINVINEAYPGSN